MNDAHLHLLFNHYPIIGTLFGVLFLGYGLFAKNKSILHAGLLLLFLMALLAIPTQLTGEGAEEIVEELGVDHDVIHAHEEAAELAFWFMIGFRSIGPDHAPHFPSHQRARYRAAGLVRGYADPQCGRLRDDGAGR